MAEHLVGIARLYLLVGGISAAAFLLIGLDRIAPSARGAYFFRPLLVPGLCLLWPLVLVRWILLERDLRHASKDTVS
ncbi:hypothetical protein [Roseibium algae]|uniref:DUF2842 domain-containing protein n=1 Tax=Roseibium algae TaxID=3123038 RepID=A0ABU8TRA5_9HYPH